VTSDSQLILTALPGLPLIRKGDDLANLFLIGLDQAGIQLEDGDLLVVAQKIVSKAEGRVVNLGDVDPSEQALQTAIEADKDPRVVELILRESNRILRTRPGLIIVEHRLGFVCANAGIDGSNISTAVDGVKDKVVLLPENPDAFAQSIVSKLGENTGAQIGVIIVDTHGRPWREGAVGVVIGIAGVPGVIDLRGTPDLFGEPLLSTQVGIADEVASAASILMGQAAEGLPVVHVRGFPYPLRSSTLKELMRPAEKDLFRN
jgi:coenzyme F420-0:L-glutamate ligase/coenzyme F420-1:gamma-L-glutamate ligase